MHSMPKKQALACAVSALVLATGAQARELTPSLLQATAQMTPTQRAAFLRHVASPQGARAASGSKLDTTPPVLKSFQLTVPKDTAAPWSQIRIEAESSDDLSGVAYVSIGLVGPHGQFIWAGGQAGLPSKQSTMTFAIDVSAYTEPGTWTVSSIGVNDAAGNYTGYSDPQSIAQFGPTAVTLANSRPEMVDYTPPVLTQGTVVTPSLSASGTQKGTMNPPFFGIDLTIKDAGAGVQSAWGTWCLADMTACLNVNGYDTVRGETKKKLRVVGNISGAPVGDYLPYQVIVFDWAGYGFGYNGTDFGGTTDFGTLMPGGDKITITP
jgi:hypothetical protein